MFEVSPVSAKRTMWWERSEHHWYATSRYQYASTAGKQIKLRYYLFVLLGLLVDTLLSSVDKGKIVILYCFN